MSTGCQVMDVNVLSGQLSRAWDSEIPFSICCMRGLYIMGISGSCSWELECPPEHPCSQGLVPSLQHH